MKEKKTRVVFVCLGNICRSPVAEGVFRHLLKQRGLEHRFEVDSAGTSNYHIGDPPDERSAATAFGRGVTLNGRSRQLSKEDLISFDHIVAMDSSNLAVVQRLKARYGGSAEISSLRDWDSEARGSDVPDPYYGGARGFEDVHDIIERSCIGFLDYLLNHESGP